MNNKFSKSSYIDAPVEEVFSWFSRAGAIERLSPPWIPVEIISNSLGIKQDSKIILKIKIAHIFYEWHAFHVAYSRNKFFTDIQVKGPFKKWIHHHLFTSYNGTCKIEDRIEFRLPFSPIGDIFNFLVRKKLKKIFSYRHVRLAKDISSHMSYRSRPMMKFLVSGASGSIGSNLVPFLTSGGHCVKTLVRRKPRSNNEIFWNPDKNKIDLKENETFDAVIHLAGENISTGLWTKKKKNAIMRSRVNGTRLLSKAILNLHDKPKVFISASATGYYGNSKERLFTESDESGKSFLSEVCLKWENAAENIIRNKIRTVFLRIGIVLFPQGGILKRIILPFKFGLGGKIGTGQQYMSWICIDDLIDAIYHIAMKENINGPVNLVSPFPVTNRLFSKTLGKVVRRPTLFNPSEKVINAVFGEMGREVLLSSIKVKPEKLLKSGFNFKYPNLEHTLNYLLGMV